jgi:hypothetical protein
VAPSSRSAARRYADRSRRRRSPRVTKVDQPTADESAIESTPAAAPAESSTGPVIQHKVGETRVTIAPKFRSSTAARPSTFESSDYRYVMTDLHRVLIVAGSLTAGLIALSLVIR